MKIDAHTQLYCILGNPVRHSLSPLMHNISFKANNMNAVYLAFQPESIQDAIQAVRSLNISGCSVTIPYKIEAMSCLDHIDPLADDIGSINTIVVRDGMLHGYNTDGYGALMALKNKNVHIAGQSVLIIGNGGSARAIAFTLLQEKACVTIAGRNVAKITALCCDLHKKQGSVHHSLLADLTPEKMKEYDIIINTTPIGMQPDVDESPLDEQLILEKHTVFDIIYSPDMTRLLQYADIKKCTIVKGIDMLIYQGIKQFELWTGAKAPYEEIYTAMTSVMQK